MELLKLVIVDDEPILLQGLLETYEWNEMGFSVVGTAKSGEEAIEIITKTNPHVVLTDIRMKKITGLMVMEEIQKRNIPCLFIVLSAYRDFEYAQKACELGAFSYLLKPIEDDKLHETMQLAYEKCQEKLHQELQQEQMEDLIRDGSMNFLQMIIQKYVQNSISYEKTKETFDKIPHFIEENDLFLAVCADIDISYKIINSLGYETQKFSILQILGESLSEKYVCWEFETPDKHHIYLIKTRDYRIVKDIRILLNELKKKNNCPIIASISNLYENIEGMKKAYEESIDFFELASVSGASAFNISKDMKVDVEKKHHSLEEEVLILNAVRKNNKDELKKAFIQFIYNLPDDEIMQCKYLHKMMLQVEFNLRDSYGMTEEMERIFQNYYSNLQNLKAMKAVDVCYKILCTAIEERMNCSEKNETRYFSEYMSVAVAYIEEHLDDENLSIISVAEQIYLNPVYFGRVFKNTFHMTFKKYLLQQRMERAKKLIQKGNDSMAMICEKVGISNPSYFSYLFKSYTGVSPSEYKKEYEI